MVKRKARLRSLVFESMTSTCGLKTMARYPSFRPKSLNMIFFHNTAVMQSWRSLYTVTPIIPGCTAVWLYLCGHYCKESVLSSCLCSYSVFAPCCESMWLSLCFIFPNRKQRNGSESEYTEKLQQYSKSLWCSTLHFSSNTIHFSQLNNYWASSLTSHLSLGSNSVSINS